MRTVRSYRPQNGFTMVELLLIIVVLGIAAATLTMVSARSAELSATMLRQQQATTLAHALLEEVRNMPFTYCDPSNLPLATTANSTAACGAGIDAMGPEAGEQRLPPPALLRFDHVNDYNGFVATAGTLRDVAGNLMTADLPTVANCRVSVAVANQAVVNVNAGDAVRIAVTVQCPEAQGPAVVAEALRIRYAPNRAEF